MRMPYHRAHEYSDPSAWKWGKAGGGISPKSQDAGIENVKVTDPLHWRKSENFFIFINKLKKGCPPVIFPLFPASLGIWYFSANPIFQEGFLEQGKNRR